MTRKPAAAEPPSDDPGRPPAARSSLPTSEAPSRPKPKPPSIRTALNASLRGHAPIGAHDKATVNLAKKLATKLDETDDADTMGTLATKLLAVLTALGLTPAARAAAPPKGQAPAAPSRLDMLRAEADERRRA